MADTATDLENGTAPEGSETEQVGGGDWLENISPQYREAVSKAGLKSPDDLVKNWQDAQSYVGKSVRIPTEEAGEDQLNEFYNKLQNIEGVVRVPPPDAPQEVLDSYYAKLGRPDAPDKYRAEDIEGFEDNPEALEAFRKIAHDTGLNQNQFNAVRNLLAGSAKEMLEQQVAEVEAMDKALEKDWGEAKDHKIGVARGAMRELMGDDLEFFEKSGLSQHPAMLRAFAKLGDMLGEPQSESPSSTTFKTPADYDMEIEDIRNRPEYWDSSLPGHKTAINRVNDLTKRKNLARI